MANMLSALVAIAIVFTWTTVDTTRISSVEEGSPAYEAQLLEGDRILSFDGKRTFTPTDFLINAYFSQKETVPLEVDRGGERVELSFQPLRNYKTYVMGASFPPDTGTTVEELTPGFPAQEAGLKVGDRVIAVDDVAVSSIQEIRNQVNAKAGEPIELLVQRKTGEEERLSITPLENVQEMVLGFRFSMEEVSFLPALKHSVFYVWSGVKNVGVSLKLLTTGQAKTSDLSGPIGIVATMTEVVSQSVGVKELTVDLLDIFAMISIAIGATNLIPFPPLDGSKLVLLGVEAIIRRPVPMKVEAALSLVGMALLLVLVVMITISDIGKVITSFM